MLIYVKIEWMYSLYHYKSKEKSFNDFPLKEKPVMLQFSFNMLIHWDMF